MAASSSNKLKTIERQQKVISDKKRFSSENTDVGGNFISDTAQTFNKTIKKNVMSMNRTCPNCYRQEGVRFNFGGNYEAEAEFHRQHWCSCGYSSPEEMMQDQDLGFNDPRWVGITKSFLNEYYLRISQGRITNKDEHVRFFLKLLKSSINNYRLSVELVPRYEDEDWNYIYDGSTKKEPQVNIFDGSYELKHLPAMVALGTVNDNLLRAYKQSQNKIAEFEKKDIKKNRWITGLIFLLIFVGILAIVF